MPNGSGVLNWLINYSTIQPWVKYASLLPDRLTVIVFESELLIPVRVWQCDSIDCSRLFVCRRKAMGQASDKRWSGLQGTTPFCARPLFGSFQLTTSLAQTSGRTIDWLIKDKLFQSLFYWLIVLFINLINYCFYSLVHGFIWVDYFQFDDQTLRRLLPLYFASGSLQFFQILFDELARPQCEGNQLFLFVLSAVKSLQAWFSL